MRDFRVGDEVQYWADHNGFPTTEPEGVETHSSRVVETDENDGSFATRRENDVGLFWFRQPSSRGPWLLDPGYLRLIRGAPEPATEEQPAPIPNSGTPIWDLVIEDMTKRDKVGRERYGTPLQANNGRDSLRDAYEEALDLVVYLRQAIEERK